MEHNNDHTAFAGSSCIAAGPLESVLRAIKSSGDVNVLIFEDDSGRQVDFDFRGSIEEVIARAIPPRGPGRPKLGVSSREISLLPRHWEWLEAQPNGASAALRRLVDEARQRDGGESATRRRAAAAGRVMTALAGNLPRYEEASRALYAHNQELFSSQIEDWPKDIREYLFRLTAIVNS
ncbi:MAG: DUF2239 family protein [Acidobacteria bacterium]|nr:DUF2239 family protein [Acidobacteriota bacterium]